MKKLTVFLLPITLSFSCMWSEPKASETMLLLPASGSICATNSAPVEESLGEQVSIFFSGLVDTQSWPARWQCGIWSPFHGWLYILSDAAIALSYFLIPIILLYFIYRGKQRTFRNVIFLFFSFILLCGLTHLIDASIFWWPAYRLSALVRFLTASISFATVIALVNITPKLLTLRSPETLEGIVQEQHEELKKSSLLLSYYQQALDASSIVAITNQYGIINYVNDNFCAISKYSREELIGKDHRIINSGYHSKEFITELWQTIRSGKVWKGELKNKAKDGTIYWVDTTIVPFLDETGKPYQYMAIRSDITERKNAEQNLERSLKETSDYKYALEESSIIAITDQKGIIKYANDNFCKISKYRREELIGQDHRIISSGYHSKEFIRNLWTTIANGEIWKGELKNKAKDGTVYWVDTTIVPFLNEQHKPYQYLAIRADITERKKAEENLEKSLKETSDYKYALDESSIVAITDQKGIIKHANGNFCAISKFTREELLGQDHRIINSGYHSKEFIRNLWVTIAHGEIWKGELKNKAKDGTVYWVDTTIVPFLNEHGKPYQYVAIRADITARKQAEEEIRQLNADLDKKVLERTNELQKSKDQLAQSLERVTFLASITNNIQDIVISSDSNFRITRWNETAEKLLEWKSDEVLGKRPDVILNVIYPHETREEILNAFEQRGFWRGEVIYHTKSGSPLNILATASHLKDVEGNVTGNLILARDITDRIAAERKLKEFEYFFINSNDFSCIANAEGYFEILNPSFNRVLGYTSDELSMNPFLDFVHPEDIEATLGAYQRLQAGATIINFVNRYRRKDGQYLWFDWNATPNTATGKLYCIARDITDRKKAEEALTKLNAELEAFSYSVSHDLRAPLRAVNGYAKMLEEDYDALLDENGRRLIGIVRENARHMGQLIDDLLAFSRLGRKEIHKENIDMKELVQALVNEMSLAQPNVQFSIDNLHMIAADKSLVRQVWFNYISNAVKYSSKTQSPSVVITSALVNEEVIYSVTDNGTGFDMAYAHKLFRVFQRLHTHEEFEGTGVGLAIVDRIISKHGGKVWAESKPGKGATFYFSLPAGTKRNLN